MAALRWNSQHPSGASPNRTGCAQLGRLLPACHGTNGNAQGSMVTLAGTPQQVIAQKMQDYKAGRVPTATIMHQLAKGYTDDEINAIAAYFAAQKK